MAKCNDAMHGRAMDALASLSQTAFGRAALEKHNHQPLSLEEARAHKPSVKTEESEAES